MGMGNNKTTNYFNRKNKTVFTTPWSNPGKHGHSQINGHTKQTQDLIILEDQTRKRS